MKTSNDRTNWPTKATKSPVLAVFLVLFWFLLFVYRCWDILFFISFLFDSISSDCYAFTFCHFFVTLSLYAFNGRNLTNIYGTSFAWLQSIVFISHYHFFCMAFNANSMDPNTIVIDIHKVIRFYFLLTSMSRKKKTYFILFFSVSIFRRSDEQLNWLTFIFDTIFIRITIETKP